MSTVSVISRTPKPGPHPAGRRCAHPTCTAFLSRYNGTDYCSLHGKWWEGDEEPAPLHSLALMRGRVEDLRLLEDAA